MPTKLIHLTDPHFVPPGRTLYGRDPRPALDAAVRDINVHHRDAELVVLTGDLTHWGESAAFEQLAAALAPLTMPVRLLVGNHDRRDAFRGCFPEQPVDENGFVQSVLDCAAGRLLFLDTVVAGAVAGGYCERRRRWLSQALAERPEADLFLFMHHPPFATGLRFMDGVRLLDDAAFHDAIAPHARRIRHLFFGHVHRPVAGSWLGIPITTLRATNHQVALDLETETDCPGSFEPPAYCVVLIDEARVIVHFHDFMDASPRFDLHDSSFDDWARPPAERGRG